VRFRQPIKSLERFWRLSLVIASLKTERMFGHVTAFRDPLRGVARLAHIAMIHPSTKERMHPRNRFRGGYDFASLVAVSPKLRAWVRANPHGDASIDYADPAAVLALNQALLRQAYGIATWDIPPGALCPPIPGRSDYLHHLADLIARGRDAIPRGPGVRIFEVGVGASCIYPLIGAAEYGWSFVGSEVDRGALTWAQKLADANRRGESTIECRLQEDRSRCFRGVIRPGEFYDASMCNPPFHASAADAASGSDRKRRNLGLSSSNTPSRNFGGQAGELWCPGGELGFVLRMIAESVAVRDQIRWFTSLVSKSAHLPRLEGAARDAGALEVTTIEMGQGQKRSRILAWTFAENPS
jgi:23S rRNA (adenine1618-N6)-methyltransferase